MPRGIPNKQADNDSPISKMEAVRQALAELGREAKPKEIRNWARDQWKLDLETNQISAYKSLLNKQAAEARGQATSAAETNKMEAVRRALGRLGNEAKPKEIQSFLETNFGIEMETSLISNYKSTLSRKAASQSALIQKPAAAPQLAGPGVFSVEEIQAVKDVVEQLGADRVQQLAEILGK
jgi:hypothetical protein